MQNRFDLLVTDVMPIYMIMPRYSHNYAQFCQLLNSNSFTHHKILMLLREATSETYGPGSIFIILIFQYLVISFAFTLLLFYIASLSQKYQKYYLIISIRSHSRKWPWRDWQPLIALVERSYLLCAGTRGRARNLLLDWYLGSQKLREILTLLLLHHSFLFKENQHKHRT